MTKTTVVELEDKPVEFEELDRVNQDLLTKIDNCFAEIRKVENGKTTIELIDYVSKHIAIKKDVKNKDKEQEVKNIRKYLLSVKPYNEDDGISRGAYDMMNQRVSKGSHLVHRKKLVIKNNKLQDKKGDSVSIAKIEEEYAKLVKSNKAKQIEVVEEPITMPQNDDDYLSDSVENFNEVTESYQRADIIIQSFQVLLNLNDSDLSDILNEHDLQTFVKDNHKPLKHIFDRVLESGKQQSKVA